MAWYSAGSVSVTNDNNAVIGTGTDFIANARVGDAFLGPDGRLYQVTNVASATALSISPNYVGTTGGGLAYKIIPIQGYNAESARLMREIIVNWGAQLSNQQPWTYAPTAAAARDELGLGSISTQDSNSLLLDGTLNAAFGSKFGNTDRSDPLTLDWYHEGQFIPLAIGSTSAGAATYTSQAGKYTRIGNIVFFSLTLGWSSHTGTGELSISLNDIPYSCGPVTAAASAVYYDLLTVGTGKQLTVLVLASSKNIALRSSEPAGGSTPNISMDTSVASIRVSGHYFV